MKIMLEAMDGGVKVIHNVESYYSASFCNGVVVITKDGGETYYTNYKIKEIKSW